MSKRTRDPTGDDDAMYLDAFDAEVPAASSNAGADGYTIFPRVMPPFLFPVYPANEVARCLKAQVAVREKRNAAGEVTESWNELAFLFGGGMCQPFDVLPAELLFSGLVPNLGQSHLAMLASTNRYFYCMLAPMLHAEWFAAWPSSRPWSSVPGSVRYERRQVVATHQTALMAVADGDWALCKKLLFRATTDGPLPLYGYAAIQRTKINPFRGDGFVFHPNPSWQFPVASLYNMDKIVPPVACSSLLKQVTAIHAGRKRMAASMCTTHAVLLAARILTYATGHDSESYMEMVQQDLSSPANKNMALLDGPLEGAWREIVYWPFAWSQGSRSLIQDELDRNGTGNMLIFNTGDVIRDALLAGRRVYNAPGSLSLYNLAVGATVPVSVRAYAILERFTASNSQGCDYSTKLLPWVAGMVGYKVNSEWDVWRMSDMTGLVGPRHVEWLCRSPQDGGNTFVPMVLGTVAPLPSISNMRFFEDVLFADETNIGRRIGSLVGAGLTDVARRFVYEHVAHHYNVAERGDTDEERHRYAQRVWNNLHHSSLGKTLSNLHPGNSDFLSTLYRTLGQLHDVLASHLPDHKFIAEVEQSPPGEPNVKYHEAHKNVKTIIDTIWKKFVQTTELSNATASRDGNVIYEVAASLLIESLSRYPQLEPLWLDVFSDHYHNGHVSVAALRHLVQWTYTRGVRVEFLSNSRLLQWLANTRVIGGFVRHTFFESRRVLVDNPVPDTSFREFVELVHVVCSYERDGDGNTWRALIFNCIVTWIWEFYSASGVPVVAEVVEDALAKGVFSAPTSLAKRAATTLSGYVMHMMRRTTSGGPPNVLLSQLRVVRASLLELTPNIFKVHEHAMEHDRICDPPAEPDHSPTDYTHVLRMMRLQTHASVQIQIVVPLFVFPQYYGFSQVAVAAYPALFGSRTHASHEMFESMIHLVASTRTVSIANCTTIVNHARARHWPANMTISSKHATYPRSVYTLMQSLRNRGFPDALTATVMTAIEDIDLANMQVRPLRDTLHKLINVPAGKAQSKGRARADASAPDAERDMADEEGNYDDDDDNEDENEDSNERMAAAPADTPVALSPCVVTARLRTLFYVMDRLGRLNRPGKLAECLTDANRTLLLTVLLQTCRSDTDTGRCWALDSSPAGAFIRVTPSFNVMLTMLITHGYMTFAHFHAAAMAHAALQPALVRPHRGDVASAASFVMPDPCYTTDDVAPTAGDTA